MLDKIVMLKHGIDVQIPGKIDGGHLINVHVLPIGLKLSHNGPKLALKSYCNIF